MRINLWGKLRNYNKNKIFIGFFVLVLITFSSFIFFGNFNLPFLAQSSEQSLQKIHLHLTGEEIPEKINNIERSDKTNDPILWFFLENSLLNYSESSNEITGLMLGRHLNNIKNSAQLGGGWTFSNSTESKLLAEEIIELSKEDTEIKSEDNFIFLVKKVGIPKFSETGKKIYDFSPKYIYDLKKYAKEHGKKGFIIIGNPEFCCANNQSIFVGFLN